MNEQDLMALVPVIKKLGVIIYMAFEWWLGRTSRVKHNSTIDLVWGAVKAILSKEGA